MFWDDNGAGYFTSPAGDTSILIRLKEGELLCYFMFSACVQAMWWLDGKMGGNRKCVICTGHGYCYCDETEEVKMGRTYSMSAKTRYAFNILVIKTGKEEATWKT